MEGARLQTLDRGFLVLRMLAEVEGGMKVAEIAERLGVHRAIAYRLVGTLEANGMAQRLPDGPVVLGAGLVALGARAEGNLRLLVRPVVDSLATEVAATAFLSIADGDDGVAILTAEPRDHGVLNVNYRVGTRHPLDRGAAGIAILAGRPEGAGDSQAVREARHRGYSITRGQLQPGAVGVASPATLPRRRYPALECSVGVVGLEGLDLERAAAAVQAAAHRVTEILDR